MNLKMKLKCLILNIILFYISNLLDKSIDIIGDIDFPPEASLSVFFMSP